MKRPKENVIDANTAFGQYVSQQMKKIPEGYAKEMLKIEIQQSILKVMLPVSQPFSNLVTIAIDDLNGNEFISFIVSQCNSEISIL